MERPIADKEESRLRLDRLDAPTWMTKKFEKTQEGYLKGRAAVTSIGVFEYRDTMGNTWRELRLPEEVFNSDSLSSITMVPVTMDHPSVLVTSDNIKQFQIGVTGGNPSSAPMGEWNSSFVEGDGLYVSVDIVITDADAILAIENGKRALSAGYTCDLEVAEPDARWLGMEYDFIQRNIRYNHVAVVDKARQGDAARIRLDSLVAKSLDREEPMENLKTVVLDSVEYKAEAEVLKALNQHKERADGLQAKIDEGKTLLSKIEAERDTLKDTVAELQAKVKELETSRMDSAEIDKRVQSLLHVRMVADALKVEVKDGMSELELMKASILAKFPKTNLDEKDEVYIRARFDGVVELLDEQAVVATRELAAPSVEPHKDSADSARAKMIERLHKNSLVEQK